MMMIKIPSKKDRAFLRNNKQVFHGAGCSGHWMTIQELRDATLAGKADHWDVIDIDLDTGEHTIICAYCATGVGHPAALAAPPQLETSGRLLH